MGAELTWKPGLLTLHPELLLQVSLFREDRPCRLTARTKQGDPIAPSSREPLSGSWIPPIRMVPCGFESVTVPLQTSNSSSENWRAHSSTSNGGENETEWQRGGCPHCPRSGVSPPNVFTTEITWVHFCHPPPRLPGCCPHGVLGRPTPPLLLTPSWWPAQCKALQSCSDMVLT